MSYRRRASPPHAARAGVAAAYCLSLGAASLLLSAPLALGATALAIVLAGVAAGVGRELLRAARFAVVLGLAVMIVNALVVRDGLTVILRLGDLPVLGQTDVTLEATAYGAILGLRAVALSGGPVRPCDPGGRESGGSGGRSPVDPDRPG